MNIIVGTAGHIDHGKTTLIKALTGTDTDRLPEEKKRGITIDLGFAELDLGEHRIGFVDVPGHERFVKNMLAGASGIDLVLLIISSDEGVMPQTREHFDICRLLGVQSGLIVLTKKDLVDDELLDLVRLEAAELAEGSFLENAPVVAVSSTTGEGLDYLLHALTTAAASVHARRDDQVARLAIDRSFVMKGFGTVVTGTVASGSIREGGELELMPGRRKVRVRGLQTHGKETRSATAGQRAAVNLAGVDHDQAGRGMALCEPETLEPVQMFDARVEMLKTAPKPLRSRQRVRVHIGTAEVLARVRVMSSENRIEPGSDDLVQLRLEASVTAVMGETFIIRSYSPQTTIAGGRVIDPMPVKHRTRDIDAARSLLNGLEAAHDDHEKILCSLVRAGGIRGADLKGLQARTGWRTEIISNALIANAANGLVVECGGIWLTVASFEELKSSAAAAVADHHKRDPLSKGMPREMLREKVFSGTPPDVFKSALAGLEKDGKVVIEHDLVRLPSHSHTMTADEALFLERAAALLSSAGLAPQKAVEVIEVAAGGTRISKQQAHKLLAASGEIVRVSEDFYFAKAHIDALVGLLRSRAASLPNRLIDVPSFKDLAGVSRKYAIPLLEYFDRVGVTKRAGDKRIIV